MSLTRSLTRGLTRDLTRSLIRADATVLNLSAATVGSSPGGATWQATGNQFVGFVFATVIRHGGASWIVPIPQGTVVDSAIWTVTLPASPQVNSPVTFLSAENSDTQFGVPWSAGYDPFDIVTPTTPRDIIDDALANAAGAYEVDVTAVLNDVLANANWESGDYFNLGWFRDAASGTDDYWTFVTESSGSLVVTY